MSRRHVWGLRRVCPRLSDPAGVVMSVNVSSGRPCCSGRQVASMHLSLYLSWVSCVVLLQILFYLLCGRCGSCYRIILLQFLPVYILILVGTFGYILCYPPGRFLRYYHLRKIRNTWILFQVLESNRFKHSRGKWIVLHALSGCLSVMLNLHNICINCDSKCPVAGLKGIQLIMSSLNVVQRFKNSLSFSMS